VRDSSRHDGVQRILHSITERAILAGGRFRILADVERRLPVF